MMNHRYVVGAWIGETLALEEGGRLMTRDEALKVLGLCAEGGSGDYLLLEVVTSTSRIKRENGTELVRVEHLVADPETLLKILHDAALREPSAESLREIPEVDFSKANIRRNPYAKRIAEEGVEIVILRGEEEKP